LWRSHGRHTAPGRVRTRTRFARARALETIGIRSPDDARIQSVIICLAARTIQSAANTAAVRCALICGRGLGLVARTIASSAAHAAAHALFVCISGHFFEQ
jgi:hypothetical protein